jgi:hypothetical protein
MPITSADRDEARKVLKDDYGIDEPTQGVVEKKAGEIASTREMKEKVSRLEAERQQDTAAMMAQAAASFAKTTGEIAETNRLSREAADAKEREKGKRIAPVWGTSATAAETEEVRQLDSTNIPFVLSTRLQKMQPIPISVLRPSLLEVDYKDTSSAAYLKIKAVETVLDIDDDLSLASDWTDYLVCHSNFVELVKLAHENKPGSFSEGAVQMIAGHFAQVCALFMKAKDDGEKIVVLLYDIERRKTLFKPAPGKNINISGLDKDILAFAGQQKILMLTTPHTPAPNVFKFLPRSSTFHPQYNPSSTSNTSGSTTTATERGKKGKEKKGKDRKDPYPKPDSSFRGGGSGGNGDDDGEDDDRSICFSCDSYGHSARECPKVKAKFEKGSFTVRPFSFSHTFILSLPFHATLLVFSPFPSLPLSSRVEIYSISSRNEKDFQGFPKDAQGFPLENILGKAPYPPSRGDSTASQKTL